MCMCVFWCVELNTCYLFGTELLRHSKQFGLFRFDTHKLGRLNGRLFSNHWSYSSARPNFVGTFFSHENFKYKLSSCPFRRIPKAAQIPSLLFICLFYLPTE